MSLLCASVDCYVCVNIKCNMQNDNAICKMALHLVLNFWCKMKMKLHNLHLPFHILVLICILKCFISGKIKMKMH